jgi:hypothetical protein
MRALLLAAAVLLLIAAVPAADARPPQPGGGCQVQEEYVTEARTSGSPTDGTFAVEPGAHRPIECYY